VTRVLVTGATGVLGRHALAPLLERDYEVHAVGHNDVPSSTQVEWHRCDLLDSTATRKLIENVRPTHLLHLAWYAEHGRFWSSPLNLVWVAASLVLLRAFEERGGERAVLAGTCAEYKWSGEVCRENATPLEPATLYGTSKNALREVAERFALEQGFGFAWGRVFFLYGPHESPARLVPFVIRALLRGEEAKCSPGQNVRDFLHVEDVASAFVALLASDIRGAVNIASGTGVMIRDVVGAIGTITGKSELIRLGAIPDRNGDPRTLPADISRLRDEVGWKPRWTLRDGLAYTVDWWRGQS
jgi:nucleoside-diphosphate-sugar epimerase